MKTLVPRNSEACKIEERERERKGGGGRGYVPQADINAYDIAPVAFPASVVSALVCTSLHPLHEIYITKNKKPLSFVQKDSE